MAREAKPPDIQRLRVIVVVGLSLLCAASLAGLRGQLTGSDSLSHRRPSLAIRRTRDGLLLSPATGRAYLSAVPSVLLRLAAAWALQVDKGLSHSQFLYTMRTRPASQIVHLAYNYFGQKKTRLSGRVSLTVS